MESTFHVVFIFFVFLNGFDFFGDVKITFPRSFPSIFPFSSPHPHPTKKIPFQPFSRGRIAKPNSKPTGYDRFDGPISTQVMLGGTVIDPYIITYSLEVWTMNPSKKAAVCLVSLCPNPKRTQQGGHVFSSSLSWHGLFTHVYILFKRSTTIWYFTYTSPMGWLVNRRKTFIPQFVTSYPPWN